MTTSAAKDVNNGYDDIYAAPYDNYQHRLRQPRCSTSMTC